MTNSTASTAPVHEPGWLDASGLEVFRWLLKTLFDLLAPINTYGKENLNLVGPGGYIVALNHLSYLDAPLLLANLPRGQRMTAFGTDKYRSHLFFAFILRLSGVIWVNREDPSPETIKAAVQLLRNGGLLGIAPEGTRSRVTRALQEGKTGAVRLAILSGVPIVPAAVVHTEQVVEDLKHLRRSHVTITFGKPIRFATPARHERKEKWEEYTTELMCQIAALLPAEYRGVYADHPRLQELLSASTAQLPAIPASQGD